MRGRKSTIKNPRIIQLRIPGNLYDTISGEAWKAEMSRNAWITMVLKRHIDYLYRDVPDVTDPANPKMPEDWVPPWT